MNEEEIIDEIKYNILNDPFIVFSQDSSYVDIQIKANAIQGLLDLYQKEKEKNKELTAEYMIQKHLINGDYIAKSKIKAKIEELEKEQKECILYKYSEKCDECMEHCWTFPMIRVLQELLEEE